MAELPSPRSCLAGKRRVAIRFGKIGLAEPAINRSAMPARMRPGTVEPTGVIASSPKHSRIVPSERPCKLDVSQPTVTYPEGTRDKISCSTREVGAQSFVSIGISCARIAAWCPEFLLRRTWPRWVTSHVDLRSPTMSVFAWDTAWSTTSFRSSPPLLPQPDINRIAIPQCSSLQAYLDVLSFGWAWQHPRTNSEHFRSGPRTFRLVCSRFTVR